MTSIVTWNVNGFRARKDEVLALVAQEQPDVLCLQELKATEDQLGLTMFDLTEYTNVWHGQKGGYSGTSIHLKKSFGAPKVSHPACDHEGRVVEAALGDVLIGSVYAPNGGKDFVAKMEFFRAMPDHVAELRRTYKRVMLCGDFNIAREPRDVHPTLRKEVIGQRADERALLQEMLSRGLEDVARKLAPEDDRLFTWWPYWRESRQRNIGWRLDYVFASPGFASAVKGCTVLREYGTSDHAPIRVDLEGGLS